MRQLARRIALGGASVLALGALSGPAVATAATPPPATDPSAVGNELVPDISVSPDYASSGFALAMSYASGSCSGQECLHLWATHDRGASWSRVAATGWQHGMPSIAMGPGGHAVVLAGGSVAQRSDDGGATWRSIVPQAGAPAAGPPFAADGTLVIAGEGSKDLLVHGNGQRSDVVGSGGTATDMQFAYAPGFPSGGRFSPVLLSAIDSKTSTTLVEQCTTSYACSAPVILPTAQKVSGAATLVMSPAYADDGTVFALEPTTLFKSTDGGHTFTPVSIGEAGAAATAIGAIVLDPHFGVNHTAYAAVLQVFTGQAQVRGGVYATTDGGVTWARIGSPSVLDHGATSVALAPDGRLFAGFIDQTAGGSKGLMCFDGKRWQATCGTAQSAAQIPKGHAGPPPATPCTGTCAVPGVKSQGTANAAGGAVNGGASGGAGQGGNPAALAPASTKTSSSTPRVVTIALVLLVVLGGASLVARLRERRRLARDAAGEQE